MTFAVGLLIVVIPDHSCANRFNAATTKVLICMRHAILQRETIYNGIARFSIRKIDYRSDLSSINSSVLRPAGW
jgi:hypothetical protein